MLQLYYITRVVSDVTNVVSDVTKVVSDVTRVVSDVTRIMSDVTTCLVSRHQMSEYEQMTKDVNRSTYTRRILEIVSNIKKQKTEIDKVIVVHM